MWNEKYEAYQVIALCLVYMEFLYVSFEFICINQPWSHTFLTVQHVG